MKPTFEIHVEDYYHSLLPPPVWPRGNERIITTMAWLLEALHIHKVKAVCYVLGDVAERYPALIHAIHNEGHAIGSHGFMHLPTEREGDAGDQYTRRFLPTDCVGYRRPYWKGQIPPVWCGGLGFRCLPYPVLLAGIKASHRFYCHPWEFDLDPPKIPVKGWQRRHYWCLTEPRTRLWRLLEDVEFATPIRISSPRP